jgi:2-polyprenyl-3-methyl-5-hydroxy-6-metoxy-1,4-benzoquinol methylase
MTNLLDSLKKYPSLTAIVEGVLAAWPEHERYCISRFAGNDPEFLQRTEEFSALALANMGEDFPRYASDYRWMCEEFLNEEIYFRRNGRYRLSTFAEANAEVYANADYMSRYVRGILISQVIWDPHARAFDLFRTQFLAGLPKDSSYLEVGPGHGFFLYFASRSPQIARLEGWDVSDSSIQETRSALARLGVTRDILIVHQDVLEAPSRHEEFDAAVISEVLEHLERPDKALRSLHSALKHGGRIFINAPINSPAPDHIYLWRSTDEFTRFVEDQGFRIDSADFLPVTGATLERAVRNDLSISCVVIASKV